MFTVALSQPNLEQTITVAYATADGTAKAGINYTPESGTLTFSPGESTATISVPVLSSTLTVSNPSFFVNLSAPNNATISQGQGVGTIVGQAVNPLVVTNTNDSGLGSLRNAIEFADANPSNNPITFAINIAGSGPFIIQPRSPLPAITHPLTIDATTQPGYEGTPVVVLDGSQAGSQANGLYITGGGSTVKGLTIERFSGSGVQLQTGGGNTVVGDNIGTNASGGVGLGNAIDGVLIADSSNNTIGGIGAGTANVISGNSIVGVRILGSDSTGNVVEGNFIGTSPLGSAALGNKTDGVFVDGAPGNTIGGQSAAARNVISGNGAVGVQIDGATGLGNLVEGNYIGTDASGTNALGNAFDGVFLNGSASNTIGGTAPSARNVISANQLTGVRITGSGATDNLILNNLIGTDSAGTAALGNRFDGVFINGAPGNVVGGTTTNARNVISGNGSVGVQIFSPSATGNQLVGNFIGTDISGLAALGNGRDGVFVNDAPSNSIGGSVAGSQNVISANGQVGLQLFGRGASGNVVQGNLIGTGVDGITALGNEFGLFINGAPRNTIGGPGAAQNTITNNTHTDIVQNNTPKAAAAKAAEQPQTTVHPRPAKHTKASQSATNQEATSILNSLGLSSSSKASKAATRAARALAALSRNAGNEQGAT